jgi:hypothetical protein
MKEQTKSRNELQIAGLNLSEGLAMLAEIEAQLHAIPSAQATETSFRVMGNWLVSNEILRDRLGQFLSKRKCSVAADVPGFPIQNPFSALRCLLFARRMQTRTSASAVFIGRNLRAFYNQQKPLSLWVGRPPLQPELAKTMAVRSRFSSSPGLRIPQVIEQDTTAATPYILEELISGRHFGQPADWNELPEKLLPPLFKFYDHGHIRHCQAAEIYDTTRMTRKITDLIKGLKWKKTWGSRARFLATAEQCLRLSDETIPLCIGHGDLGKSNLLVTFDGSIALLDWERSREMPIAADLIKLILGHLPLLHHLAPLLQQRTENPAAMTPNRQFLLATLDKIVNLANYYGLVHPNGLKASLIRKRKLRSWVGLASNLSNLPD